MINLLPREALKTLQANYRQRRQTVAVGALLALLVSSGIVLGVLRYKVQSDLTAIKTAMDTTKNETETAALAQLTVITNQTTQELAQLALVATSTKPALTEVITSLTAHQVPGLALTDLLYDASGEKIKIGLQGRATTRAVYLEWLKALRADPLISDVNAPLSDLIHDQNISFSISLTFNYVS